MGTSLDAVLRSMGVTTLVVMGVSVNVGVLGLVLSAVDLGYRVVVVRDAVAGVPAEYADSVLDLTISMLASVKAIATDGSTVKAVAGALALAGAGGGGGAGAMH